MRRPYKNWEVGSTWYTAEDCPASDNSLTDTGANKPWYLSTCRSAIGLILDSLHKSGTALVPAFTCHSVIEPFTARGYDVLPYPLNDDLSADCHGLISMAERLGPTVVLVHGYFGFDTTGSLRDVIPYLKDLGVTVIEDLTQNMFSDFQRISADYRVGSIRKWMPIPDGAFVTDIDPGLLPEDSELADAKLKALRAKGRYIFDGIGEKSAFMPLFTEAERLLDSRTISFGMSDYSRAVLSALDRRAFAETRRGNYSYLASRLSEHPEIKVYRDSLAYGEVPFLLPVSIGKDRADFQAFMAARNVYPTVIWKCPEEFADKIDSRSRNIYDSILCFHVDQRYDRDDMARVADIVDSYFSR